MYTILCWMIKKCFWITKIRHNRHKQVVRGRSGVRGAGGGASAFNERPRAARPKVAAFTRPPPPGRHRQPASVARPPDRHQPKGSNPCLSKSFHCFRFILPTSQLKPFANSRIPKDLNAFPFILRFFLRRDKSLKINWVKVSYASRFNVKECIVKTRKAAH